MGRTAEERFWTHVVRGDECWEWTGARASGYGRVYWSGKVKAAHRVAYELFLGPIPDGLQLDHLCRNRGCVNPMHLEPVTQRTNLLRGEGIPAIKAARTHCPNGHAFTTENVYLWKGARYCRICRTEVSRRRNAARPIASRSIEGTCSHCGANFVYTQRQGGGNRTSCSESCRLELRRRAAREFARRKRAS